MNLVSPAAFVKSTLFLEIYLSVGILTVWAKPFSFNQLFLVQSNKPNAGIFWPIYFTLS